MRQKPIPIQYVILYTLQHLNDEIIRFIYLSNFSSSLTRFNNILACRISESMDDLDYKQKPFIFGRNMVVNSHKFHICRVTKFIVNGQTNVIFTAPSTYSSLGRI